ncbi:MAG: rane protein [Gemmatimonadetes bacterium]|jgi:hypothetical protein|nr:rane protein [Gemmatimonadota bacterium]
MHTTSLAGAPARPTLWAARTCFTVAVLFLIFDSVGKLAKPVQVVEAFGKLGIPMGAATGLGILQLACLALYVVPRTAVLGAVLLTGYLGGAIAIHVRAGSTPFELLFPVILGALLWAPLYLRDERVRRLLPVRG